MRHAYVGLSLSSVPAGWQKSSRYEPHLQTMHNTSPWDDLSVELWVHVLLHLYRQLGLKLAWHCRRSMEDSESINNVQKMRLVCTKFNTALNDAQFSSCVFLREGFHNKNIPSLLQWVQRHRPSVQVFVSDTATPVSEAALSTLVCPGSQLHLACMANPSAGAVHILSCHFGLHTIEIESTLSQPVCHHFRPCHVWTSWFSEKAYSLVSQHYHT